jgi:hypothetical protein
MVTRGFNFNNADADPAGAGAGEPKAADGGGTLNPLLSPSPSSPADEMPTAAVRSSPTSTLGAGASALAAQAHATALQQQRQADPESGVELTAVGRGTVEDEEAAGKRRLGLGLPSWMRAPAVLTNPPSKRKPPPLPPTVDSGMSQLQFVMASLPGT